MASRRAWQILLGVVGLAFQAGCLSQSGGQGSARREATPRGTAQAAGQTARDLPAEESSRLCLAAAEEMAKSGQDVEAAVYYEKARSLNPRLKEVCRQLAVLYDRIGETQRAKQEYQKALALNPKDAELHNDLGYSCYTRGHWAEAEKHLRKSVALDPTFKCAWINLGLALGQQKRYDEALQAFARAVTPAQAQSNLAFVYSTQGKRDEARKAYDEALRLDPDLAVSRAAMAKLDSPPGARKEAVARRTKPAARPISDVLEGGHVVSELQPTSHSNSARRPDAVRPVSHTEPAPQPDPARRLDTISPTTPKVGTPPPLPLIEQPKELSAPGVTGFDPPRELGVQGVVTFDGPELVAPGK
jgi:tetratricopeptide (TPR) repeat protein